MRLFSYCVKIDDGAAPNAFWGICTLTICKPIIRRTAKVGDWIFGIGSKNVFGTDYSGKLVYAMQVTEILTYREYDMFCRKSLQKKIPDIKNKDYRRKVGDCLYDYSSGSRVLQRPGVHLKLAKSRDCSGKNALLSDHFYYFGDAAVEVPKAFSTIIRQGQGHQLQKNEAIKLDLVEWITSNFQPNKIFGSPQVHIQFIDGEIRKSCGNAIKC